ncbi:molybdenum cofactor guanylyltransferase [Flavobacterium cellulosilyticum]|uniref:Probable molybdenum cofactor guanylyltransferase n=1 Tax=Flavobacterium cellulosilyticum TaxID=2541731 RepID=A0A4R5CFD4_9FLAO|nr:molybdenum cofactor guanylyltransferase [Flavobacterium cellulosilyticum]TDD98305.1 molybdenum cofactor guanylyltransferase [Flavobacterium cellulosilyticum]
MSTITGIILAGGKSERMGTDKGLLVLKGKPFISHIYDALKPIVGDNILVVSSNAAYDKMGYNRIEDLIADKGPIGGLYTALKQSKTKINLVLSVDVPLVTTELLEWLLKNHDESYLMTQVQVLDKASPLVAVYDRALRIPLGEHLASNQLKLRGLIDDINHQTLQVPLIWSAQVKNINTNVEYQKILK